MQAAKKKPRAKDDEKATPQIASPLTALRRKVVADGRHRSDMDIREQLPESRCCVPLGCTWRLAQAGEGEELDVRCCLCA